MTHTQVYLALGSNLGDRESALETAIERLSPAVVVEKRSHIYQTAPMYVTDQPAFLNMVIGGQTALKPLALLDFLKNLEREIGRIPSMVNGPRAIDLDILYFGEDVRDSDRLVLPHPRIAERAFVLVPLADIAPDLVDPRSGMAVQDLCDAVSGKDEIALFESR